MPSAQSPFPSPERLRGNVKRIQFLSFFWMFMLLMPVIVPFLKEHGLSIQEILTLQSIFAIAVVLLELPSGYLSDLIGRRGCLVAAGFLRGLAFTWLALANGFWDFALFQLIAALSISLYSGSDVALLYDSLEGLEDHHGRRRALGRRLLWMQSGETFAALIGGAIVTYSLSSVAVGNAILGWLPFLVSLTLVEVPSEKLDQSDHLGNLKRIWRQIFHGEALLRMIMFSLITYGLSTLLAVWLFQDYWQALDVPLVYFGYLWAAYNITVAIVGRLAHRVEDLIGPKRVVRLVGILPVIGFGGMGLCSWWLEQGGPSVLVWVGVGLGFLFQIGRGLTQVVIKDALNTRVEKRLRATANSIASLGVRLAYAFLGPCIGWIIVGRGHAAALWVAAALFGIFFLKVACGLARRLDDVQAVPE